MNATESKTHYHFPPRVLRASAAVHYLGSEVILSELRTNFGLRPFEQRKRLTAYLRDDVDAALNRYVLTQKSKISPK